MTRTGASGYLTVIRCSSDGGVQRFNKLVGIRAVNIASFLDGFAARRGTSEAVHSDAQKQLCGFGVLIEYVADDRVFSDFLNNTSK